MRRVTPFFRLPPSSISSQYLGCQPQDLLPSADLALQPAADTIEGHQPSTMSSPRRLRSFILADSDWRREPEADTADLWLSKVTSKHTETTHLILMIRAFIAAEEWGRLKGESPRRIHTDICWDKSKGTFKFEAVDEVVQHRLPSEIMAELDAIKQARILFAPWAVMAAATATFVEPEPLYRFQEVLFDADEYEDLDETVSSTTSSLFGTMTSLTELSEDESEGKDAPASAETEEPIGLGLTLPSEEQVLEWSIDAEPCVERNAEPTSASVVGLGIPLAEGAHVVDKKTFGRSTRIEDCTILDAASASTSALDAAPRAPRFNRYAFEGYAVPEAATTPPAPQPNTFAFELSPSSRVSASASSSSPTSTLLGTIGPPTEVSEDEDKGAPASGAIETPIGLGLALPNEEQMFGCSTYTEACTVLGAESTHTSTLDSAPGTPRFNTFAFEEYAVQEAGPSHQSAPPAPQPNTFVFEQSPAGRMLSQSPSPTSPTYTAPSESSSSGSDEYIRRAAALLAGRLPLLMYSMRAHKEIFTSAVNRASVAAEIKSASIWGLASKFFSAVSAAALRNESFYVNFVDQFEDEAFGA